MHVYIYDQFLNHHRYEKVVSKIETRITDLGLHGKNCRLGPLRSLRSVVIEQLRSNPKTIVAVGNDETLHHIINLAAQQEGLVVGYIPVGNGSLLAPMLGIDSEDSACNILSARLIEYLDLGMLNDSYFISSARIPTQGTIIEVNERYTVEPAGQGMVEIVNLPTHPEVAQASPTDGCLETFITINEKGFLKKGASHSYLASNNLIINNLNGHPFVVDGVHEVKTPVQVTIAPKKLPIIVGKNRLFSQQE